ncbi:MFS transporter [Flavihumibacter profundi]|uniref:MFS transporter n=1 Tax=Flavihumibacter profundi TaxID=2716883 RepID=UPI001CC4D508|nr:MFS transporter [Flavihumibacter profundi]MBZ5857016.1 MFS transporter [Flavihumibacter profundi]
MLNNTIIYFKHRPSRSIGFLFMVSSLLLGIWVAAIPQIKTRLGLSDASLGLSLLLAPIGALTGVVVSPFVFKKIKVGKWLVTGHLAYCCIFILQVIALNPIMLWLSLFGNGLIGFLNGVSANAVVDQLEKKHNRHIMSTSHGMYSTGGFVSAGLAAIFYSFQMSPFWQIIIVAGALIIIILSLRQHLFSYQDNIESDSGFSLPSGSLIGLAFICFVTFMGEGCVADWSAIYMKESLHSSKAIAGLGFAGFSIAMAIGRLNGDNWIPKYGSKRLAITGSLVAALGFLLAIAFSTIPTAIAGFTLIGIGFCCIVPILFSAATGVPGVSPVKGISAVASGGLIGFLAGPSMIGLVAEQYNVAAGLSIVFFLAVAAAIVAWKNDFLMNKNSRAPEVNYLDQHF